MISVINFVGTGVTAVRSGNTVTVTITSGGGSGTVTSFSSGNLSPLFTTSVATATTTPALTFALSTQVANTIFAGPTSGLDDVPTFRALVAADIPSLAATYAPVSGGNYWPITGSKTLTGSVTVSLTNTTNISSVISSRGSKAVFTVGNGAIQNSNGYITLAATGLTAARGYTLSLDPNNETGIGNNLTFTNTGVTVSTIVYAADYSADYTTRSLVDKGYVASGAIAFTNKTGNISQWTNDSGYLTSISGAVTSVSGTANRITSTGGSTPVIDISTAYVGQATITTLGTIATGVWNSTAIGVAYGGTNIASYAVGDLIYASGATTLSKLADVATGNALISGGVTTAPSYGKITSSHVDATVLTSTTGWLVTGTTTMTGAVTLASPSSSTPKPFQFTGTWTGTAASDYHVRVAGTITGDATTSRIFNNVLFDPTLTAGANSQILTNLTLNATYADNSKTSVQHVALRVVTGNVVIGGQYSGAKEGVTATPASGLLEVNDATNPTISIRNGASSFNWLISGSNLLFRIDNGAKDIYITDRLNGNHTWTQNAQSATHTFLTYTQAIHTGGSPAGFLFTQGAHTTLATTAEATTVNWNLSSSVQWATGTVALQRFIRTQSPTITAVAASTFTRVVVHAFGGPTKSGTNVTITDDICIEVEARDVSGGTAVTRAYAALFNAPTGAASNWALKTVGNVNMASLPTSASGLVTGDLWNNSGIVTIV